ncbi:MAG: dephospho-CoA kinase [Rhodobacteraceae bacterium]|nr:dephospho-CoA kinase [Paracoccaceae bacterium]
MTYRLGLTGSIGMGKSTTADFFRATGVPVWDADEVVYRIYQAGGVAVPAIRELRPSLIYNGAVARTQLRKWIAEDETALSRLEVVVHPLVAEDRQNFLDLNDGAPLVLLDIPLLFETGADRWLNGVLVVTTNAEAQRQRVLSRPGMDPEAFDLILSRQMPDAEKRARADFVIRTRTLEQTRTDVETLIREIMEQTRA